MQTQSVSALPAVAPGQISGQEGASTLPVGELADPNSFEALLDNHVQALVSEADADPDMLLNRDPLVEASAAADSETQLEIVATVSDLGALLANILQTAPVQVVATAGMAVKAADVASSKLADVGVSTAGNDLPIVIAPEENVVAAGLSSGRMKEEIAASGKELPVASGKLESAVLRSGEETHISSVLRVAEPVKALSATHGGAEAVLVRTDVTQQVSGAPTNHQAAASVGIEARVGAPGWDAALGQKVVWLASQHQQSASMQLNPPNLGPLEVRLSIANDQANAMFVSHQPAVRDAIEAALPRLREMLAENGITLGNVQVSAESFPREQGFDNQDGQASRQFVGGGAVTGVMADHGGVLHLPARGLVDIYA